MQKHTNNYQHVKIILKHNQIHATFTSKTKIDVKEKFEFYQDDFHFNNENFLNSKYFHNGEIKTYKTREIDKGVNKNYKTFFENISETKNYDQEIQFESMALTFNIEKKLNN